MGNKKIGIVTFHRAYNFGANLQAYALQQYINREIGECEIIDYTIFDKPKANPILYVARLMKRVLKKDARNIWRSQKKFIDFQNNYYTMSNRTIYQNDTLKAEELSKYKILISGSDQILNTSLTNNSSFYYLPFEGIKKISFSSSFGRSEISENDKKYIRRYLKDFSVLSCREQSAIENIKKEINDVNPQLTCDPVFLLNKKDWSNLINRSREIKSIPKEDYILVYAMEYSKHLQKCLDLVKKKYNLPVVAIYGDFFTLSNVNYVVEGIGPIEFLNIFNRAKYIVTNSFHGLAFSIILEKNFYICSHSTKNTRIDNLLGIINKQDALFNEKSELINEINGSDSYRVIDIKIIKSSKEYLKNNLK